MWRTRLANGLAIKQMSQRIGSATYLGTRYVTDGKAFGVVKLTTADRVWIVDARTKRQYGLRARRVRRMTLEEIEQYNSLPSAGDPTGKQIAERSAAIRSSWTDAERRNRSQPRFQLLT